MLWEGVRVDRWVVEEVVGEGATSVVYRAHDPTSGDVVALKVPAFPSPASLALFASELRCHRRVQHPNVVSVRGELIVGTLRVMVLDFVEGQNLADFMAHNPERKEHIDELAAGLVAGVAAIHGQKIVHRDLKPGNVLLEADGDRLVPRIIDFGLARLLTNSAPQTTSATVTGTPGYMAPEQFRDADRVGQEADVFSLGVILYELVCGTPPFAGDSFRTLNDIAAERYVRPSRIVDVPERVEAAIIGALRPDPADRIPDCATLWAVWSGQDTSGRWKAPPLSPIESMSAALTTGTSTTSHSEPTIIPDLPLRDAPAWPPPLANGPSLGNARMLPTTEEAVQPRSGSGLRAPLMAGVLGLMVGAAALLLLVPPTPTPSAEASPAATPAPPVVRSLSVITSPAGAQMYEGNTPVGITPYTWTDDGKAHSFRIELDGYDTATIDIDASAPETRHELRLTKTATPAPPTPVARPAARPAPAPRPEPKPEPRRPVEGIKTSR